MSFETQLTMFGEVVLAAILAGLIGLERELAGKPAGLKTHMLVAVSASLLVSLGNIIVTEFEFPAYVTTDPIRIIEAVVVGISFLGAGTIFRQRDSDQVEGLTTAASILAVAAIGIGTALEMFMLVSGVTVLVLLINGILNWVERRMHKQLDTPKKE
jgi:putative Mg2+ transporter-C (MgtC) family protein